MSYSTMVTINANPAIFNDVNFITLINPTTIHKHTISLIIILCELYHQPINTPVPIVILIT